MLRLENSSEFFKDIFFWDIYKKNAKDGVANLFTLKRVKNLKQKHSTLLLKWIGYAEEDD